MKATLWMKSSCTTCRDAKVKLAELGVEVEVRDFSKIPLEAVELDQLLPEDPTPYLGSRSPAFRALGLKGRVLTKAEAIALMVQDNNLLKRPILVHPRGLVIGFDPGAYEKLVS